MSNNTIPVRKLKDKATGAEFVPVTHWDAVGGKPSLELQTNKVTTMSAQSTNAQYPSAKAVYDAVEAAKEEMKPLIYAGL